MTDAPDFDDPAFATRLLGALPAAAFVIDGVGVIRFATESAARAVGLHADTMVGRSVLEFVDAQTSWAYAAAVAMATDYPGIYMGPLRITFITPDGERAADLWATNHLDDPDIQGIVCLMTEETAANGLSDAISAIAGGQDLDRIMGLVASAMRGQPVVASAAVVVREGDRFRVVTPTDLPLELFAVDDSWRAACDLDVRVLHGSVEDMPPDMAVVAEKHGKGALWVEPVPTVGDRGSFAALVLWRERPGNPSPNQLNSVFQAAGILAVAFRLDGTNPLPS